MSLFDVMDWPNTITKKIITPGYTNQTTGVWVPEVAVSTTISAHVADMSLKELRYIEPGIVEKGVRKLSCEASVTLEPGDRVTIYEDSAGDTITEWKVESRLNRSGLMNRYCGIDRNTYLLSLWS